MLFEKIKKRRDKKEYLKLINLKFRDDIDYKRADIYKSFKDRYVQGDDKEVLSRIINAYNLAIDKQKESKSVYKVSNEWLPIYEKSMGKVMNLLKNKELDGLQKTYDNFWRNDCSSGLLGLSFDMEEDYFGSKISNKNKKIFLNDTFYRYYLWKDLMGYKYKIEDLTAPLVGNPYGIDIDGVFLKSGFDYLHYYATTINRLLKRNNKSTVIELGGGYGGMAYYLNRDNTNLTYIDVDLPENLALASYYLMKCFPEKKIVLYGESQINQETIDNNDIIMLPSFAIEEIPDKSADLFFNSYSLAEMGIETIDNYLKQMDRVTKKYFYHVNHTKNCAVGADNFPVSEDKFLLLSRNLALWNAGRNPNMDEFEYLYLRN